MTTRLYSSISQETTLVSAMTSSQTTMVVNSASAVLAGSITPTAGQTFTVVIDPDTSIEEIVDVVYPSSPASNTLTIVRGIATGGTGIAHSAGAKIRHMATGRDFTEANTHHESNLTAHAATTSAQLASVISDETGSGSLVFGTSPTIVTPTIASFTNATHNHTNNAGGGTLTSAAISDFSEAAQDAVGDMFSGNTESGIAVTYDDVTNKVNFDVNDPTISIDGDISGSATMTNLGNVTINTGITAGVIVNADISGVANIAASKIAGTAVTQADTGTVTSTMIANGTIVDADVNATAAIAKTKLNLGGTITSADLVDGTIVASDIADGTITAAKMVSDPYARANHTGTQLASTISNFDTQVRSSRLDQMAAPTTSVAMNAQKITGVADPTLAQDASTKAYVDAQVNALVNGAPGTLDTLGEIAAAISAGGSFTNSVVLKTGSTMTGDLVLNANPTVALGAATKQYVDTVAGSASAAAASAAAAAASYDSFDDRYLGAKSTPPTLDNDGNALVTGAIYWDSVSNAMYAWSGSAWGSISSTAAIYRFRFTAAGGETTLSGADANGLTLTYLPGKEQVYLNGVLLVRTSDYNATSGTSITSLAALTAGDVVEIITFTAFDLASAIPVSTFDAKGDLLAGTAADTVGKLTVGSNGTVLMADSTTATGLKWSAYDPLPSQTGNSGKYLTTNGSTTSWGAITTDPTPTVFLLMGA